MKTLYLISKIFVLLIAVLLSFVKLQAQTPGDAEFKKPLDLLSIYMFIGNYIDSTRNEIRTEGESVFYQTELQFPGAIEKYIEVTNGKGLFKAVLYRGNDLVAAENKCNEIAEIVKRVKDNPDYFAFINYCSGCTGVGFGRIIDGKKQTPFYWVQNVHKPGGIYEVQLIYTIYLDKYYFKKAGNATVADFPVGSKIKVLDYVETNSNNSYSFYSDRTIEITGFVTEAPLRKDANGKYAGCLKTDYGVYGQKKCFPGNKVELIK